MDYLIQCEKDVDIKKLVADLGGTVKRNYFTSNMVLADIPDTQVAALAKMQGVTAYTQSHPDDVSTMEVRQRQVNFKDYSGSWGVDHIRCPQVHASGNTGQGIKVAVIDTGSGPHTDLKIAGGFNVLNPGAPPNDDNRHGSHCAGIIAAQPNTGEGVTGAAYDVDLYAVKMLSAGGSGSWADLATALEWCIQNGMDVVSMSLGGSTSPGETIQSVLRAGVQAGIIFVASAGNRGAGSDTVGYPAKFEECIAVASTANRTNARSSFSSTGPAVEVAAPGSAVRSCVLNNGYAELSGTSIACPHVAGVIALALAAGISDPRKRLETASIELGAPGRDPNFGWGLIDAVNMTGENTLPVFPPKITCDPSASTDDKEIASWRIDWGDNSANGGPGHPRPIPHDYTADGIREIVVTCTDAEGAAGKAVQTIEIRSGSSENQPPEVRFTITAR